MKKVFALLVVLVVVVALLMVVISRLRKETSMPLVQPGAYEQSRAIPFREAEILTGGVASLIDPAIEFVYVSPVVIREDSGVRSLIYLYQGATNSIPLPEFSRIVSLNSCVDLEMLLDSQSSDTTYRARIFFSRTEFDSEKLCRAARNCVELDECRAAWKNITPISGTAESVQTALKNGDLEFLKKHTVLFGLDLSI